MKRYGVIDSGEGGAFFCKNLNEKDGKHHYCSFLDRTFFPYGNKPKDVLLQRLDYLIEQASQVVDEIIIACNTLSYIYLGETKQYSKKVYDIITPTLLFLEEQQYQNIVILATYNTVSSHIYANNLSCRVHEIICSELIEAIEHQRDFSLELESVLSSIPISAEVVVLACTHFIKIKDIFRCALSIPVISQDEVFYEIYFKNNQK